MDDKISIIKSAYGIIPPDAMTVNEILYHQCKYIKENAVKGDKGEAATIKAGTTTTLPAGSEASVTNVGNENNAVFNFAIPQGEKGEQGEQGEQGEAATVQVGEVTTLPAGSQASVTNVGNENDAVFNFAIPQGEKGEQGESGTPVIDLGTVTLIEQDLGGVKVSFADSITVSTEQATQAQATSPCIAKVTINGATHEFSRISISSDASAHYVDFTATEERGGESTYFYRLTITIALTGGTARATLFVFEYPILQGLNLAYEAGELTFENGVATKALTNMTEWLYNQIRFSDKANSNEEYTLYRSHVKRGATLINSNNFSYFGLVENASVTGEDDGVTAFIAYIKDNTLTVKKSAII